MITNFKDPSYLGQGNQRQREAFNILQDSRVLEVLSSFDPVLVGTIPIEVDLPASDLDIICSFQDESKFEFTIKTHCGNERGFRIRKTEKQGLRTVIAVFQYKDFVIEIFGQPLPVIEQLAFRHMIKEYEILQEKGDLFRQQVIQLKERGFSTEAAFAKLLEIKGDPYLELLAYRCVATDT